MNLLATPGAIRRVAMIGTHTPRQCGVAALTADLCTAISARHPQLDCFVAAVNDPMQHYPYPECVRMEIRWTLKNHSPVNLAEGEGFEPPVGCPTSVFKTGPLDRSGTLPRRR